MIIKGVDFSFDCDAIRVEKRKWVMREWQLDGTVKSLKEDVYSIVAVCFNTPTTKIILYNYKTKRDAEKRMGELLLSRDMNNILVPLGSEDLTNNDL